MSYKKEFHREDGPAIELSNVFLCLVFLNGKEVNPEDLSCDLKLICYTPIEY